MKNNGTWILVDLPPNVKSLDKKWIYKSKHKRDGSIERFKTRQVAKWYNQIEKLDYIDIFSPIFKLTNIKMIMDLASINN